VVTSVRWAARLGGGGDTLRRHAIASARPHEGEDALARTIDRPPAGYDGVRVPPGEGRRCSASLQQACDCARELQARRCARFFRSRLVYCWAKRRSQLRRWATPRVCSAALAPMQIQREPARRSNLMQGVLGCCQPPRSICYIYTCGAVENICQVGFEYGAVVVARYRSTPSCDSSMSEVVSWESESQLGPGSSRRCAPATPTCWGRKCRMAVLRR